MSFDKAEFFALMEHDKLLNPKNDFHLLKIIVIDNYTIAIKEAFYPQKDTNIKIDVNYDLVRWNNKKIEQIVCFYVRKLEPDFSKKWLKSINLEHIE